jgi:hypothetical protein
MKKIGLERSKIHWYRWNGSPWYPGVTSIVGKLDKSGPLIYWAKDLTAKAAVHNYADIGMLIAAGREAEAIDMLIRVSDMERDRAADLGTRVHAYAEAYGRGQELPELKPSDVKKAASYMAWVKKHKPRFEQIEFMVFSLSYEYGGTGDALFWLPCKEHERECLWLVDYKTGKGAYATTALQLAGLQYADFIGEEGNPEMIAMPFANHFGVLHVREDISELIEYSITEEEWITFRALRQAHSWTQNREKNIQTRNVL